MSQSRDIEVAVVGGGPAGAAVAAYLASAGREVVVFERLVRPRWRACGVYSSPLTRRRLARLGLEADQLAALIQPIPQMVIRTAAGDARCHLEYPAPHQACGLDRVRLEEALLELIRRRGVSVFEGAVVRSVELGNQAARLDVSQSTGRSTWRARIVVGADGPTSVVARAAGVARGMPLFRRAALTGHRAYAAVAAQLVVGNGWYLGIAPVPAGRVNLGLVMSEAALRRQLKGGAPDDVVSNAVTRAEPRGGLVDAARTDDVATHLPLLHRVTRAAGPSHVLVGDAAGFVDPISGEGLHRALVSAEMAAEAIEGTLRGDSASLGEYDRHLRARFRSKDVLSWALQLFLLQPWLARRALRRLDRNQDMAQTFAAALADFRPATSVLDPRFVGRLLA